MNAMHAWRVLEFDAVRKQLADHCQSLLGVQLAQNLEPSFDPAEVEQLRNQTQEAYELLAQEMVPGLQAVSDLRREAQRVIKGATLDGESLFAFGQLLATLRGFRSVLKPKQERFPELWRRAEPFVEDTRTEEAILRSLDSGGEVLDSASPELSRLRRQKRSAASRLVDRIQSYTTGATREYLSDPIVTQRSGRYVVPVRSEHRAKIRGIVHDTSGSGQTLFVEPAEIVEIGNSLREAEAAELAEVARILKNLSERLGALGKPLVESIEQAADLDLILARARHGYATQATLAEPHREGQIVIEKGRHPLLDPEKAVPLYLSLQDPTSGILITGPNTGGKTVALKTVGLYVLMNQCGMMLPASRVRLGFFRGLWADIGDEQSLQQSLSTFSAHIKNIGEALRHLGPATLVIFDELGAGTDPAEGAALAKAILFEIQASKAKVIASTHYGELKLFAANTPGFENSSMEFDLKTLQPTYRLLQGTPGASHALKIAERYGMPKHVVERARQDQGVQSEDVSRMLEQLENAQRRAQKAQSEADRLANRLREVEATAERKLQQSEEIRRTARQKIADAVEEEMRQIRLEVAKIFEDLKRAPSPAEVQAARERLKFLDQRGRDVVRKTRPERAPTPALTDVQKGMAVRIRGYTQMGTVIEAPRDGKVLVQIGPLKMTVKTTELEADPNVAREARKEARRSLQLEKASVASMELDLRGGRAEDAQRTLEKFLDDSILAGLEQVRIVHGKGEGILRQMTREVMRKHPGVEQFRDGEPNEGGQGVTVAALR